MKIDNKFSLGEIVYLVTDNDQLKRIVTAIIVCNNNALLYELSCGKDASKHYDYEISSDVDMLMKTSN